MFSFNEDLLCFDAEKLIKDISKKRNKWDERSQFKIKGIGNLSISDLDILELYANTYLRYGSIASLMRPLGTIRSVLEKY